MQKTQDDLHKVTTLSEKKIVIIKLIIFVIILFFFVKAIQKERQSILNLFDEFQRLSISENVIHFILIGILFFLNWAFEAKKWQILVKKIERISFLEAYQSIIVGLTLSFISPINLGDFAGRLMKLKSRNRLKGIGSILLGNGIQFYTSILFGALSYTLILNKNISFIDQAIFGITIFTLILGIVIFIFREKITLFIYNFSLIKKYKNYVKTISEFDTKEFRTIFFYTTLRYLTFSLQFVIVLLIFRVNVSWPQLWAISCLVLLYKTIIPPINFLSDLGVRAFSALHFFSLYSVQMSSVISATFFLWVLNILLPMIVGSFLLLKYKLGD